MDPVIIKQEVVDYSYEPTSANIDYSNIAIKQEFLPEIKIEIKPEESEIILPNTNYTPHIKKYSAGISDNDLQNIKEENIEIETITIPLEETLSSSGLFSCAHCSTTFSTKVLLQAHITDHIQPNERTRNVIMYLCIECNKGFLVKPDFDFHINLHRKDKIFHSKFTQKKNVRVYKANKSAQLNKCMICDEKFENVQDLKQHSRTAHVGPSFYKCDLCKEMFALKSNYDKHLKNHENVCNKCNNEFPSREALDSHLNKGENCCKSKSSSHHENLDNLEIENSKSKAKFYGCPFCVNKFPTTECLKVHTDRDHALLSFKEYSKPVKIEKSNNVKNTKENSTASSLQNGKYIEEQSQLEYLKKYLVPRNGLKLYECFICQKTFYTAQTFKSHLLIHPDLKSKKNSSDDSECVTVFECEQCKDKFNDIQFLKKHIQHHSGKPPYVCKKCDIEFCSLYYLRSHFRKCFNIEFYACDQCDEIFDLQEQLNDHLIKHSSNLLKSVLVKPTEPDDSKDNVQRDLKIYKCKKCEEKFPNEEHLKCHLLIDCGIKSYECLKCKAHFSTRIALNNHLTNHNKFIESFSCEECEKLFTSRARFKRHLLIHTGEKPFECDVCKKKFYRQAMLISHHLNFHTKKSDQSDKYEEKFSAKETLSLSWQKLLKCDVCNEEFKTKSEFKNHKQTHADFKRYECDICKKKFLAKFQLKIHLILHLGIKPYQCNICQKRFAIKRRLLVHMLTHTSDLYLKCEKCQRSFVSKLLFKNHQQKCDKVNQKRRYRCKVCSKVLSYRSMDHHMLWHSNTRKFKCKECKKTFICERNLNRHAMIHHAEKNYECKEWGKKFLHKDTLKKHNLIHTDVKPYQCKTCERSFKHHYSLRNHLVIHVKDREIISKNSDKLP